jgi:nucleoid DNA-binding protein
MATRTQRYRYTKADLGTHMQGLLADQGIKLNKEKSTLIVGELLDFIKVSVANGYDVALHEFGVFEARYRAASLRNNPQNPNVKVEVPEKYVPNFSAYSSFKSLVATYDGEAPYGAKESELCPTGECPIAE